jgi:hypothetical protein
MGMAMTILSFSMLGRFANIPVRQLTAADLNPREVWMGIEDRVYRAWNRGVKYYESMRLFVEIRSRLSELSEQDEEQKRARPAAAAASPTGKDAATAPQGSPKP